MGYNVNNTRDGIKGVQKLAGKPLKEKTVQKTKIYGFLQSYMYMYDCLKNSVINPSTNLDQWVLGLNIPSMNESQTHSMIPLLKYISYEWQSSSKYIVCIEKVGKGASSSSVV